MTDLAQISVLFGPSFNRRQIGPRARAAAKRLYVPNLIVPYESVHYLDPVRLRRVDVFCVNPKPTIDPVSWIGFVSRQQSD
jgi:hypothetical protein